MDSNDLNRRLRYALMLDDADVAEILALADFTVTLSDIASWRIKEGEDGYLACPPQALRAMLDGLITQRRGARDENHRAPGASAEAEPVLPELSADFVDNNVVLKQLRIALSLKSDEVHTLIQAGGGKLAKGEVGALFRNPAARNYRRCGDQVLRWFLAGLAAQRNADGQSATAK